MIGRVIIYGLLLAGLLLLATNSSMTMLGGTTSLGSPGGGISANDPSPVYLIPIALLIWVVLRRRKQRSDTDEYQD